MSCEKRIRDKNNISRKPDRFDEFHWIRKTIARHFFEEKEFSSPSSPDKWTSVECEIAFRRIVRSLPDKRQCRELERHLVLSDNPVRFEKLFQLCKTLRTAY